MILAQMDDFKNTLDSILRGIRGRRILVVGDAMLDTYVWGDASRISPEAPVPVVKVAKETHTAGGAANVALNIASLGGEATLFTRVGDDDAGRTLAQVLAGAGVKLLQGPARGVRTIVKTRIVCRRQQLCRLDTEAPAAAYAAAPARSRASPLRHSRTSTRCSSPTTQKVLSHRSWCGRCSAPRRPACSPPSTPSRASARTFPASR